MRLREYQNILNENIPKLDSLNVQNVNSNRPNDKIIRNLNQFSRAIQKFQKANLFESQIESIKKEYNFVINRHEDSIILDANASNAFMIKVNELKSIAKNLKQTIDNILPEENKDSINIKLPEYTNIEKVADFFNDLKSMLFVFQYYGEEAKFETFDRGSEWALITIAGTLGTFIYQIVDKGIDLRNKFLEGNKTIIDIEREKAEIEHIKAKAKGEEANTLKIKIEALQAVLIIMEASRDSEIKSYRESLIKELCKNIVLPEGRNQQEFEDRLGISLEKAGELTDKGMEIHPAFIASNKVKQVAAELQKKVETHKRLMIELTKQKLLTTDSTEEETEQSKIDETEIIEGEQ